MKTSNRWSYVTARREVPISDSSAEAMKQKCKIKIGKLICLRLLSQTVSMQKFTRNDTQPRIVQNHFKGPLVLKHRCKVKLMWEK